MGIERTEHRADTFVVSCRHAWRGFAYIFSEERNMRIQAGVGLSALVLAWMLDLPLAALALIVVISAVVLAFEMVNTALELLADVVQPTYNDVIGQIKDVAAGAVLTASVAALLVGILLIGPALLGELTG